ncbi:MAG TPA: CopD family protein [Roseomonas sp.]|nr:CopD family protein [Roseomonas sp.]
MTLLFVLHLVGAVLWVGGMAFGILAMRPALSTLPGPQRLEASAAAHRRFFLLVWHVMPVMLATGYALLFGWFGGFAGAGWHVHVMHLTGLIMSAVFLAVFFGPWRRMRAALADGQATEAAAANNRIRLLITANLALGLLTVIVAGWGRFGG